MICLHARQCTRPGLLAYRATMETARAMSGRLVFERYISVPTTTRR